MRLIAEYFGISPKPFRTEDANPNNPENKNYGPGGVLPSSAEIAGTTFETFANAVDKYSDVLELMDRTGAVSVVRNFVKGDTGGTVIAVAGMAFGGGQSNVTLKEAKGLVGGWTRASFGTIADSVRYHFAVHGAEVGAKDVWQYLRKAEGFRQNLRGATRTYLEGGLVRYTKKGQYIILDENRNIISYGVAR